MPEQLVFITGTPEKLVKVLVYRQDESDAAAKKAADAVAAQVTRINADLATRALKAGLDSLAAKVPPLDVRVKSVETSLASTVTKVAAIDPRVAALENKPPVDLAPILTELDAIKARLANLETPAA